jgi:hypothetical protein
MAMKLTQPTQVLLTSAKESKAATEAKGASSSAVRGGISTEEGGRSRAGLSGRHTACTPSTHPRLPTHGGGSAGRRPASTQSFEPSSLKRPTGRRSATQRPHPDRLTVADAASVRPAP